MPMLLSRGGEKEARLKKARLKCWAAFVLIGVPEASATLKAVHGNPPQVVSQGDSFTFPVPPGVTNYSEIRNPATKEIAYIGFETIMSRHDLIRFYSVALAAQGVTDDGQLFVGQGGAVFIKRFHDFRRNRDVEVVGSERAGNLTVRVQFEGPR